MVSAYAAAGYNVLVDGDMSEQWYQQVTAMHLRNARQPHIQLYVGDPEISDATSTQLPRHADLVLRDLQEHQRVIDVAREISKTRFTQSRSCPLCKQLRGALRETSRPQIPADIKGPSRCTYVLFTGADSTYEYQRTVAHSLQQQLQQQQQQQHAQDADYAFLDMLALHHELQQARTEPPVDVDDNATTGSDRPKQLKVAFTAVVKQLGVQFSMTPAVLINAIISLNDCNNEDEMLLYALRSHTVLLVHIDSQSHSDASAWQQAQDWSTQKKVAGSMSVKQLGMSAEQAAAVIIDKLEEVRLEAMKVLDLSLHDTQRADDLNKQLAQLLAVGHVVEDLYLGKMATSGETTAVQEQHRLDFLSVLASCPQLLHVDLKIGSYKNALFTGEHLQQCLEHIARAPQLELLMVDSWCTGDPGHVGQLNAPYLQRFYDGVAGMRIKALRIFAVDLNKTMDQFVVMLQQHPTITQLALHQCDPSMKLLDTLAVWLRQPDCKLEHLTIWSAGTGNDGGRMLLDALPENTSLRHLAYLSSGHNSDVLATAATALARNTTLQHLSLQHDHRMLDLMWDGKDENPDTRYWRGEIADRLAFAAALKQSNYTLLSCNVFDGLNVRQSTGFTPTHNKFMVALRPEIPQGPEVLARNKARAGGAYVDRSITCRGEPKSLEY